MPATPIDLFHDIHREVAATPTADLHSHLVWTHPHAHSLAHIVFYHFIQNELCAAGMPLDQIRLEDPAARLRAALPWLDRIANTGTSYCLRRMLEDLYDVPGGRLTEDNLDAVTARVAERAGDAEWPRAVLHQRARLTRVFVSHQLGHTEQRGFPEWRARAPEAARYDDLFHTAGEGGCTFEREFEFMFDPRHADRRARRGFTPPSTASAWAASRWDYLAAGELARMKAVLTWSSVDIRRFEGGTEAIRPPAEAVWQRALQGRVPRGDDMVTLRMLAYMTMVDKAREHGVPMQVFFGSVTQGAEPGAWNATHADYEPSTIREFGLIANDRRDVRFEFLQGAVNNTQEMAIMMKMRPNVGAAGAWWHAMYPSYLRRIIGERLDVAPSTKTCLFFSDAYMTEWCYGKRKLVEREFAFVLAERVAYGYLTRADASRLIRAWMVENPARTYNLPELLDA